MTKRIFIAILTVSLAVLAVSLGCGAAVALLPERYVFLVFALAAAVVIPSVIALAHALSRRIVKPLAELDPDAAAWEGEYEELRPLLHHLRNQRVELGRRAAELVRKSDEFRAATDCMNEGMVLFGERGGVISINRAASEILGVDRTAYGSIGSIERAPEIGELLEKSKRGERAERIIERNNLSYQLNVSPIVSEDSTVGFALLIFDVTERERSEQMRREFTANVSHELKTPLHSISGCAELLVRDMVRPEDVGQFAGQIYAESARMIRLVDDIIKLSRLDEGAEDTGRSEVELYSLAQTVVGELAPEAERAAVTLTLAGGAATLWGIPQMLWMIVYNLCDNAIKYNREGGSVTVTVAAAENEILLSVRDTGIGIPPEHQARVFERFYRVDKSHSKEVGGTGLGLSIVKHAARLHSARVEMESAPGKGTTITLRFPKTVMQENADS